VSPYLRPWTRAWRPGKARPPGGGFFRSIGAPVTGDGEDTEDGGLDARTSRGGTGAERPRLRCVDGPVTGRPPSRRRTVRPCCREFKGLTVADLLRPRNRRSPARAGAFGDSPPAARRSAGGGAGDAGRVCAGVAGARTRPCVAAVARAQPVCRRGFGDRFGMVVVSMKAAREESGRRTLAERRLHAHYPRAHGQ
jgi:hypothetical protein